MNTVQKILHCDGCTGRLTYQRNIALLALGKSTVDLLTIALVPGTDAMTVALSWLNPFALILPWMDGSMPFVICLGTFAFFSGLVWNSVHRARDTGWSHWLGLLAAVPFVDIIAAVVLSVLPARKRSVWDLV
ncbi:MAG: hypothetical protein IT229_04785 [Flavobacteriales bacterium]|nr:hypothetical protein [Flavobacteriales bacterium]